MAKMVGLSRAIKIEWLNKTVYLVREGMAPENIKEALNDYISFEISSKDNVRKSRDILMNLWVYPFKDENANQIRQEAIKAIRNGSEDTLAMHWCMLLLHYPVFVDVTGMIGKICSMQDTFSLAWLKGKMFEEWGERTTLFHSLDKIMQTLRQIGAVNSKGGNYTINRFQIKDAETKKILLKTVLALKMRAYYEPSELSSIPQMFPFEYEVDSELIFGSNEFEIGNFGGNPVITGMKRSVLCRN